MHNKSVIPYISPFKKEYKDKSSPPDIPNNHNRVNDLTKLVNISEILDIIKYIRVNRINPPQAINIPIIKNKLYLLFKKYIRSICIIEYKPISIRIEMIVVRRI
jgi:hypothetical protein